MDLQHGHFLAKMYAKTKELGPIGGHAPGTPPRSANVTGIILQTRTKNLVCFNTLLSTFEISFASFPFCGCWTDIEIICLPFTK